MTKITSHPVETALQEHARICRDLVITSIVGEPDHSDALDLADDLDVFVASVDKVVAAFGDYAASTLDVSRANVQRFFHDQLRNALEGNAIYEITHGWGTEK